MLLTKEMGEIAALVLLINLDHNDRSTETPVCMSPPYSCLTHAL